MPGFVTRRTLGMLAFGAAMAPALGAQARIGPNSFAPLVKRLMPTVVNIAVTESGGESDPLAGVPPEFQKRLKDRVPKPQKHEAQGAGAGFIIDPSGVIVTANHVVGNADSITVSLPDGTSYPAKLIGADELTDIAVIKVTAAAPLPAASWGDSNQLEVGDWVLAAGNPFTLGGSVTAGIVSARGGDIGAGPFDDFIQIDAPINPGNSGGPLFDEDGDVVGMNTAIYSPTGGSVGIGFAVPSVLVSQIVQELRDKGHIDRGWLGVSVEDGAHGGVAVAGLDRRGPAARSGLRPGDMILAIDGKKMDSARDLTKSVALTPPGNVVQLAVRRQTKDLKIAVTIGQRPKIEEN